MILINRRTMREYRGKRIDNGEWAYGFYRINSFYNKLGDVPNLLYTKHFIGCFDNLKLHDSLFEQVEVVPESVGQFIGIYDKNGHKVFDGCTVLFQKKEYKITYFEDFAMYGLVGKSAYKEFDENMPMGSGGSSTSYKPYVLSKYYQSRIEIINE